MTKKYIQDFKSKLSKGGTLAPEELKDFFSRLEGDLKDKKYGLVWESQTEQVIEQLKTNKVYLEEEQDLKITQDLDNPKSNILIEGDNYEALTYLKDINQKVDVIYIDPPYNTGNKDFIYNDRFIDKEDGFRHSQWLSFMDTRLRLARELLTDDGVIFISIDDNEQAQLKLLCDQIFGEDNFINKLHWRKNNVMMKNTTTFKNMIDYIYVYSKNIKKIKEFNHVLEEPTTNNYSAISAGYGVKDVLFDKGKLVIKDEIGVKDIKISKGKYRSLELLDDVEFEGGYNIRPVRIKAEFKWANDTLRDKLTNPRIYMQVNNIKDFTIRMYEEKDVYIPINYLDKSYGIGTMSEGKEDVRNILGKDVFDYPKPLTLVKWLVQSYTHYNKNATVLDFFAGSGTTGHAVLELNKEDGGNRQFILVTNNENNIARGITYERNKRVIEGYTTPKGKDITGIPANLAYYRTKQVSKYDIDFDEVILQHVIPTIQFTEGVYTRTQHSPHTTQLGENVFIFNQYMVEDDEVDTLVGLVKDEDILYIQEGQVDYIKTKLPEGVVYKYLEDVLPTNR